MEINFDHQQNAWQQKGLHRRVASGVGTHFALLMSSVLLISFLLISGISLKNQQDHIYANLKEKGQLLGHFVAMISPEAIYSYDFTTLNDFAKKMGLHKDIVYNVVVDQQGKVLTSFLDTENPLIQEIEQKNANIPITNVVELLKQREDIIHLAFPIKDGSSVLGDVWVGISTKNSTQLLKEAAIEQLWLNLGIILCISLGILMVFRIKILRPIHQLMRATHKVSSGDFEHFIDLKNNDEFGSLAASFNFMIQAVQQNNENFSHVIEMLKVSMHEKEQAFRKAAEQNWLNEGIRLFVEETHSSDEVNSLANKSVENLTRRLELLAATLFLYEGSDMHKIASSIDLGSEELTYINPKENEILEHVKQYKQAVLSQQQPLLAQPANANIPVLPWIYYVPLISKNKLNGLLELAFTERPSSIQLAFLQHISNHLAINIYAAQQQQQTQQALQLTQEKTQQLEQKSSELRLAMAETERATKAKSIFLANMSHELRTPLNAILGFSEMLLEDLEEAEGSEDMLDDMQKIHQAGQTLLSLVNDVLDISKVESGKMDIYLEVIHLPQLLNDVINTVTPLAEKNHCPLHLELDDAIHSASFYADFAKVRQVLLNLLSNAIKFGANGLVALQVKCLESQHFEFRVIDHGIGIEADKLPTLFQAFTQADASTTRKYGGTGLGLAICKEFVGLMGGFIEVESEIGQGSCFIVKIPAQVEAAAVRNVQKNPHNSMTNQMLLSSFKLSQIKENGIVLVVDDAHEMREIFTKHLEQLGYRPVTAANGEAALNIVHKLKPDAIILDVVMPDMEGWEVLTQLKADAQFMHIPVITVSSFEDRARAYALGATEHLVQPVAFEQLASVLRKYRENAEPLVMLVEDDETTRNMMIAMLERTQCNVISAENGRIALQRLQQHQPDVILLDLMMPEISGLEFAQILCDHPHWQHIPIIVLTAKDLTSEERQQLSNCVALIYQKGSFQRADLLEQIQRHLVAVLKH